MESCDMILIMNNKNAIGLFMYVSIMMVVTILPSLCAHSFFYSLSCGQNTSCTMSFWESVLFGLGIFFTPILYLLLPILVTILAITYHWSSYLDKFFNQLKLPTIILGTIIAIIILYEGYSIMIKSPHSDFGIWFYEAIVLPYCLIYSVILVHNLIRIFKERTNKKH